MKKILITGVSRGLGKSLQEFLGNREYEIYGTVRDLEKFQNGKNVKYFCLDLESPQSIDKVAAQILEEAGTLDAVIHNAGIAYLDPADVIEDQERRQVFDVNFFGPISLTEKLLPKMREQGFGKLIFISSVVSKDHWPFLGIYSASKAALECVAFEWAVLLKQWNISVSVIRPNPLPTDMAIMRSRRSDQSEYHSQFSNPLEWESIEDTCNLVLKIIESPDPHFDYQTGELSQLAIEKMLKKDAYQNLLKQYQEMLFPSAAS